MRRLREAFPSLEIAWKADAATLGRAGLEENLAQEFVEFRSTLDVETEWEAIGKEKINVITIDDPPYPRRLKEIYDPPYLLYVRGTLPTNEFALGVVGARKMSAYGEHLAELLIPPLARSGLTIVSGLALGVDAKAHEITVREGGATVAVLGSGLAASHIYPSSNRSLAEKIIASGGAVISEFPLHMPPLQHHFPYRNRIISGMTLGVLVLEAALESGSLITARHALEQNREVFTVPGDITRETSLGSNGLLRMGAHPVERAEDILEALNLHELTTTLSARTIIPDSPEEEKLLVILAREPIHIDELIRGSGLDSNVVSSTLTLMEIKGTVRHMGAMNYALAR